MSRLPLPAIVTVVAIVLAAAPARAVQTRTYAYATDFGSGSLNTIEIGPPRTAATDRAAVCADAVIRWFDGQVYVLGRFGCDNVTIYDGATCAFVRQFSVGNGSNPNDIYVVSPTKAYVARYDAADLWIVDPSTGAHTGTISLAAFADADGLPEMNRLAYEAGKLFVSVQRLDRDNFFTPTDSSAIVVVDTETDAIVDCDPGAAGVQGVLLPVQNPTTEFATTPEGDFLLGCTGFYGSADGAVVRFDPRTLAVATETTEATLGGDIADVAVSTLTGGATYAFVVLSDASFNTKAVRYVRATGAGVDPVYATSGFNLGDAEVNDRDELWLADRTPSAPGVRVFDANTLAALTASPIGTGLPPQDLCFDAAEPVAVEPPRASAGPVAFAGVWPNPADRAATTMFRLELAATGPVHVAIRDVAGRLVRGLDAHASAAGTLVVAWDGRDDTGRAVPAGVYLASATLDGHVGRATTRVVRIGGRGL